MSLNHLNPFCFLLLMVVVEVISYPKSKCISKAVLLSTLVPTLQRFHPSIEGVTRLQRPPKARAALPEHKLCTNKAVASICHYGNPVWSRIPWKGHSVTQNVLHQSLCCLRFYDTLKAKGEELEIVFVSADRTPGDFQDTSLAG